MKRVKALLWVDVLMLMLLIVFKLNARFQQYEPPVEPQSTISIELIRTPEGRATAIPTRGLPGSLSGR